jgi:hypothetical protein
VIGNGEFRLWARVLKRACQHTGCWTRELPPCSWRSTSATWPWTRLRTWAIRNKSRKEKRERSGNVQFFLFLFFCGVNIVRSDGHVFRDVSRIQRTAAMIIGRHYLVQTKH